MSRVATDSLEGRALGRLAAWPDPREVVSLSESLRLDRARVDHVSEDGVLLYLPSSKNYLHAAVDDDAARRVLAAAKRELGDSVVLFAEESHASACGYAEDAITRYRVCVYERAEPPALCELSGVPLVHAPLARAPRPRPPLARAPLRIERLDKSWLDAVAAQYDGLPEEDILRHLEDGWVYGGFDGAGDLVGFIGEHDEGTIGMLEVLPQYRRRGYARELEAFSIARMLAAGRIPHGQVVLGNEPSFSLQRSLGMTVLPGVQCWVS